MHFLHSLVKCLWSLNQAETWAMCNQHLIIHIETLVIFIDCCSGPHNVRWIACGPTVESIGVEWARPPRPVLPMIGSRCCAGHSPAYSNHRPAPFLLVWASFLPKWDDFPCVYGFSLRSQSLRLVYQKRKQIHKFRCSFVNILSVKYLLKLEINISVCTLILLFSTLGHVGTLKSLNLFNS